MTESGHSSADHSVEMALGYVLRAGVAGAVSLTLAGSAMLLRGTTESGRELVSEHAARVGAIEFLHGLHHANGADYILLGLLVLLATPVVRVLSMIIAFCWERDWMYAAISAAVLTVLLFSLFAA